MKELREYTLDELQERLEGLLEKKTIYSWRIQNARESKEALEESIEAVQEEFFRRSIREGAVFREYNHLKGGDERRLYRLYKIKEVNDPEGYVYCEMLQFDRDGDEVELWVGRERVGRDRFQHTDQVDAKMFEEAKSRITA